ncbi:MAG: HAMP domain-containing histidine kinase [Clostridia bacterium]|nr:HAMP domain-containing histidine kinase [Clostridia bacterium]
MKKYYRNRIMLSGVLSFLIILVIAVAGIWLFSYQRIEENADSFIASELQRSRGNRENAPRFTQDSPAMFGYRPGRRNNPSGFYELLITRDGEISIERKSGIEEDPDDSVLESVRNAAEQGIDRGKAGSCKFGIRKNEDGTGKAILVDMSIILHTLYEFLKNAGLVGVGIFLLLIIVLFPVSGKVADIFVRNAEEQRRFITDAGHDLKTPVAIARANLDVLELREGQNKWTGNIRAQVDRMEHLVQDLIMMARLDEGKNEEVFGETELTMLAEEIWEEYQPSLKQKQIRGEAKLEKTAPVRGAENLIRRVLCLLMDNAVQYTPENGEIRLSVTPWKKRTRIELSNSVTSLPTEKPEKLTERFVRGDSARTQKSGGSGIGLAAARRIAEKHHGKLTVDYPDEHTFRVTVEL